MKLFSLTIISVIFIYFSTLNAKLLLGGQEYVSSSFLINKHYCDPHSYDDVAVSSVARLVNITNKCELVFDGIPDSPYIAAVVSTHFQFCMDRNQLFEQLLLQDNVLSVILLEFEQDSSATFYYYYPHAVCNLKLMETVYLPNSEIVFESLNGASVILSYTFNDWQKEESVTKYRIYCGCVISVWVGIFIFLVSQLVQMFLIEGNRNWRTTRTLMLAGTLACSICRIIEFSFFLAFDLVFSPKGVPQIFTHLFETIGFFLFARVLLIWLDLNTKTATSMSRSLGIWHKLRRVAIVNAFICILLIFLMVPEGYYIPIVVQVLVYVVTPFMIIFLAMFGVAFFAIGAKLKGGNGSGESLRKISMFTGFTEIGFIIIIIIMIFDGIFGKVSVTNYLILQGLYQANLFFLGLSMGLSFKVSKLKVSTSGSRSTDPSSSSKNQLERLASELESMSLPSESQA